MSICDYLDDWDDAPSSNRTSDLQDVVNELLDSWGFDPPNWDDQIPDDLAEEGLPGAYTSDDDTIHLDPNLFFGDSETALNTAIHEALHYTVDQLGWDMDEFSEDFEVGLAGNWVAAQLADSCENAAESGEPPDMPPEPWESPDPAWVERIYPSESVPGDSDAEPDDGS